MKNLLYVIAALLAIIWIIVFKPSAAVHLLLAAAGLILLIRILFGDHLSRR